MNLFLIILLLCEKITVNAISLQKEQISSRKERFLDAILGATNNAGNLSIRKPCFLTSFDRNQC